MAEVAIGDYRHQQILPLEACLLTIISTVLVKLRSQVGTKWVPKVVPELENSRTLVRERDLVPKGGPKVAQREPKSGPKGPKRGPMAGLRPPLAPKVVPFLDLSSLV